MVERRHLIIETITNTPLHGGRTKISQQIIAVMLNSPYVWVVAFLSHGIAMVIGDFFSVVTWRQSRCHVRLSSRDHFCDLAISIALDLFPGLCTRDTYAGGATRGLPLNHRQG